MNTRTKMIVIASSVAGGLLTLCCWGGAIAALSSDTEPPRTEARQTREAPTPSESPSPLPSPEPSESPTTSPTPRIELDLEGDVAVTASGQGLTLTNNGDVRWERCEINLNAGLFGDGYTYDGFELYPAGDDLSEFKVAWGFVTNDDGERFNYGVMAPETLSLSCYSEFGRGDSAYYEW